jgi:hypothetical protein
MHRFITRSRTNVMTRGDGREEETREHHHDCLNLGAQTELPPASGQLQRLEGRSPGLEGLVSCGVGKQTLLLSRIPVFLVLDCSRMRHFQTRSGANVTTMKGVHGIRVNTISPGYMNTILNEGSMLDWHKTQWFHKHPMKRMGEPEELMGAVVMLASRSSTYITGEDIRIDGGQLILM